MFIGTFAGARPAGRQLPALASVPDHEAHPLYIIMAFARDPAKDGKFEFYDPWQLETAHQQWSAAQGNKKLMLSLAGAGWTWECPDPAAWTANAVESLMAMIENYSLSGIDIDYEESVESGNFVPAIGELLKQLKEWRGDLVTTIAPFTLVWPTYKELLQSYGDYVDFVNWQVYAELEDPNSSAEQVVANYDALAAEVGGYGKLTLGVNSEPDAKRGAQLPALLEAFAALRAKGLGGAFIWALDNSQSAGFEAERSLLEHAAQ